MWSRAAHELSARGLYVLRLDYPGVGHSSGDPRSSISSPRPPGPWRRHADSWSRRHRSSGSSSPARASVHGWPSGCSSLDRVVSVAMVAGPVYARRPSLARRLVSLPRRVLGLQALGSSGRQPGSTETRREPRHRASGQSLLRACDPLGVRSMPRLLPIRCGRLLMAGAPVRVGEAGAARG